MTSMAAPELRAIEFGGAANTRGLLMSLLGEFVLPNHGQAWTKTLIEAMAQLGVREKAARQALARTEDRGWLSRERIGRTTRWSLTPQATTLLTNGAERIYGFGLDAREWDGRWLVLLASVPERDRAARYRMSQGLSWAGFGSIGNGVWVSPWVEREQAATSLIAPLDIEATSFVAHVGQLGSAADLARQAWDLPQLEQAYGEFLETIEALPPQTGAPVSTVTQLVHEWRRFPFLDPDLPGDVLPADWPGHQAAARFHQVRNALLAEAQAWWTTTEAANGS